MIAIIDYGVGNLFSLCSSFKMACSRQFPATSDKIRNFDIDRPCGRNFPVSPDTAEKAPATDLSITNEPAAIDSAANANTEKAPASDPKFKNEPAIMMGPAYNADDAKDAGCCEIVVTSDSTVIEKADKIVLPGVGAFEDAMNRLTASGLDRVLKDQACKGKEIIGICLGMQLLFERSYEYGEHAGLGLLKGEVVPMKGRLPEHLKIPHIGWNALHIRRDSRLLKYINEGDCVYFVHSYYAEDCEASLVATAEYGKEITAMVQKDNITGCQFHPEKSGSVGLSMLKAFCE